jgi:hypothetical protein
MFYDAAVCSAAEFGYCISFGVDRLESSVEAGRRSLQWETASQMVEFHWRRRRDFSSVSAAKQ